MTSPWLGVIADDFTGATDVAAALRRGGATSMMAFGVPTDPPDVPYDCLVVALKSRTTPVAEAVDESRQALRWLRAQGVRQVFFKYCSTFDSTPAGNIGPVLDLLHEELGTHLALTSPASPEHGRTVYMGHLFVGDRLLSESSMARHPLTPMTDPDLRRVLAPQTDHRIALLDHHRLCADPAALRDWLHAQAADGARHVIADAVNDEDLDRLAAIAEDHPLVSGAAGFARALGRRFAGRYPSNTPASHLPDGPTIVVAGSCSEMTLAQVERAAALMPSFRIDPSSGDPEQSWQDLRTWLDSIAGAPRRLVYSSATAEERRAAAPAFGPRTGEILENLLARAAAFEVARGATRVVVAGGETSGAVVQELGVSRVMIAEEAARGVPWCIALPDRKLALLLKSGNFGEKDLLERASR
jgi:uncharacterized protein YgbK (DUF1537 family)